MQVIFFISKERNNVDLLFMLSVILVHKYSRIPFNPFVPNAPFLYPLKTSEKLSVFLCFQGVEKECIGNNWLKINSIYTKSDNNFWRIDD